MFSYLRPHHRRTPSNPTSPAEHSFEPPMHPDHGHPQRYQDARVPDLPSSSALPPSLPQIARVSSAEAAVGSSTMNLYEKDMMAQYSEGPSTSTAGTRDTYTFNNHPRMAYTEAQRPGSAGNVDSSRYTSTQYLRPQSAMNRDSTLRSKPFETSHNSVPPGDVQSRSVQPGRRPTGTRLPSPPPAPSSNYSTFEPVQQRSGKTRLNLLNPMSLLARRRTSQAVTQLSSESLVSNRAGNNFPEKTFDPRIRGTLVHDFSAPRPARRNVSYTDVRAEEKLVGDMRQYQRGSNGDINNSNETATGAWSGGNRTPAFTENFEENQYPAAGPHVRKADDLTDLQLPKPPYARGAQKTVEARSKPKSNEQQQKQPLTPRNISVRKPFSELPPPVPPKFDGHLQIEQRRISIESSTPPKSTSSRTGRSRNVSEVSVKDGPIPKHMKSTSSRFSFDMIGAAEQERLLEDRHRQRALEKKAEQDEDDGLEDEFEDNYDYDDMDDDDGLEERIPGVNADLEEDEDDLHIFEEEVPEVDHGNLGGFTFQQPSLATPLSPSSPGTVSTPRDANGEVIGFAMTKNSPYISEVDPEGRHKLPTPISPDLDSLVENFGHQGLGITAIESKHSSQVELHENPDLTDETREFAHPATLDDDDLYFDDGIIADLGHTDGDVEFDESVFDNVDTDEYGRPLKSLSSLPALSPPPMAIPGQSLDENDGPSSEAVLPESLPQHNSLAPQPSTAEHLMQSSQPAPEPSLGLTQDTLAAYQSALAAAAYKAAANGKFRRNSTPTNPTPSEQDDAHPGLITDSSHNSNYEPFSPSYELEDDFDYDDALEDDPIIAAANAEALANDCDGFYGQEFGFYSAPAGEAEYANGGYFGPRGIDGVNRSQSGRVVSREPNLTPITERSEYSNRNSFMSLSMHGPGSVSSPGLVQLAGLLRSPDYEGDMSLDALLKLRSRAWGGSQASLHSSNGGSPKSAGGVEDSSPVGQLAPWSQGGAVSNALGIGAVNWRKNSTFSLVSEGGGSGVGTGVQSESSSMPASPTLTMSMPVLNERNEASGAANDGNKKEDKEKGFRKHKYTGSAESISYLKEGDPVSGERWILERRRTGETGELEFLGREVVSGGRI